MPSVVPCGTSLTLSGVVSVMNYLQPDGFIAGMISSWMKTPAELDADTAARLTATRKNRLALVDDRDRPAKTAVRAWGCDVSIALIVVYARAFVGGGGGCKQVRRRLPR